MANLSVPSPGKWISDIFGKHIFRPFFGILESENPLFFKLILSGGVVASQQAGKQASEPGRKERWPAAEAQPAVLGTLQAPASAFKFLQDLSGSVGPPSAAGPSYFKITVRAEILPKTELPKTRPTGSDTIHFH